METKINITPDMIKLSKVILKNMEQLSSMVKQQDKNLGAVQALCLSSGKAKVTVFDKYLDNGYIYQDIDIEGNVTANERIFSESEDEEEEDLFEEDEDGENE
jgi:hypothetical protein